MNNDDKMYKYLNIYNFTLNRMGQQKQKMEKKTKRNVAIFLIIFEVVMSGIVMVVRQVDVVCQKQTWQVAQKSTFHHHWYGMMILMVGFTLLPTFLRKKPLPAVIQWIVVQSITFQVSLLMLGINHAIYHNCSQWQFTDSTLAEIVKSGLVMAVVMPALAPRLTLLATLPIAIFGTIGYTCVASYLYNKELVWDMGGGMTIHVYGCMLALTFHLMPRSILPVPPSQQSCKPLQETSVIGTFLIWVLWPLFLTNLSNPLDQFSHSSHDVILINSVTLLIGSVSGAFIMGLVGASQGRNGLQCSWVDNNYEDIWLVSLGGVIVGSNLINMFTGLVYLFLGFFASCLLFCSRFLLRKPSPEALSTLGIQFTVAVHGIPGLLGCIVGIVGISLSMYYPYEGMEQYLSIYPFPQYRLPSQQALHHFKALLLCILAGFVIAAATIPIINLFGFNSTLREDKDTEQPNQQIPDFPNRRIADPQDRTFLFF